jgi:hypothetical protein
LATTWSIHPIVKAGLIIIPDLPNTRPVQARSTLPVGGQLKHFWQDWQRLTADLHVAKLIKKGYRILYKASLPLTRIPVLNSHKQDPQKNKLLQEAVTDMLSKHDIEPVSDTSIQGFYFRLFLVPKKTGDWR